MSAILVLCAVNHKWMTPEHAYCVKVGYADAEFTPIKFVR
ncbi:hypothetical protein PssvBMR6_gp02 [Pseudomonas phage MR6]|uniref:Uncharacterized protein n=1 Tax=Pseudomonas phage MR5 TaxID=2711172 RepID=A0A6M3TCM3_9CAUD|nr:hypothetical protein PssvBMR5_gp02 [Pseudomonas phage MR5]QJD54830.1 hypothetical protein PssvBMR6_gp02 [Pseudomonas phage MR6]QJD54889.1 hypothetical protein PssvBMR7_gp02 [Pseudomonas phage MR7]QJD54950.1 hypothetical protein PssvBMR8_gp02 [Pseudomonas phage MR8]QJD55007.1 hypothetical protein PssvBMR12_gp02 [Pseudomonas phage MR12]QJD55310.1 hypothetical protein Pss_vB_MR16_gp02 [Pseudomonas phage MR18]QJF74571.1 hypothetical protein PssvBMR16_gp02 [Pseudomonas phage MR16]